MSDEKQEQRRETVEMTVEEAADLEEKPYQRIPEGMEFGDFHVKKGDYRVDVSGIQEGIYGVDSERAVYGLSGFLSLSKLNKSGGVSWSLLRRAALGFSMVPYQYDFVRMGTKKCAEDLVFYVHSRLKSEGVWIDPEKTKRLVHEALEPIRERRRKLAEIVAGVDFGEEEGK
jgi:hypothetical protein